MKLTLAEPNIVKRDGQSVGTWTMVYDEGFHLHIGSQQFFAFFKYTPKKFTQLSNIHARNYNSDCGKTLVGWFHSDDIKGWGCFVGSQTQRLNPSVDTSINKGKKTMRFFFL